MRKFKVIFSLTLLLLLGGGLLAPKVHAQEVDVQCIGEQLDLYVNEVINTLGATNGVIENVRLLSPAFNLNHVSPGIISNMSSSTSVSYTHLTLPTKRIV